MSVRSPFTKSDSDEDDDESGSNEVPGGNPVQFGVSPALANRRRQRQLLQEQHRRRRRQVSRSIDSPLNFEITNSRGKIARLCFFKRDYKLGETVIASFDFSGSAVLGVGAKINYMEIIRGNNNVASSDLTPLSPCRSVMKSFHIFSDATVECLQYSACLVCTEEILGDAKLKKSQVSTVCSTVGIGYCDYLGTWPK